MALMTYLCKDRHGTYQFRRVIPAALRPFMPAPWTGKANYKLSLRTKKPAEAKARASKVFPVCAAAFETAERARRGEPPPAKGVARNVSAMPSLADIEADTIAQMLADDEAVREDGDDRRHLQTQAERKAWPDIIALGLQLGEEAEEYQRANARRRTAIIDAELRSYLKRHGVPFDPASPAYREAGLAMLRAKVRGFELLSARQAGKVVEAPARPSAGTGPKLSDAFAAWKAGGGARATKRPGHNSAREAEHAVRRFSEWHDDLRIGNIDKARTRDFRDALARVPTRLPREEIKLPLRDLLKRDLAHLPPASANTINKSLILLAAIVAHAMREGQLDKLPGYANPFQGIKLVTDERETERREFFDGADLRAIFGTKVYGEGARPKGGGGEAAFWLPLIALLSGARQTELAQLRVGDLRQDLETGIWLFDIGTEGGRSIKTASSRRMVPVHPHLVKVGLLRYRQSTINRVAGSAHGADLWPDVIADREARRAGPWSKWFNRYLRVAAKVTDPTKVFHSFRHTFIRLCRDAKIEEELRNAITGHTGGGGVGRSYGGGFALRTLAEAMGGVGVPEAISGLAWVDRREAGSTESP
jgi:integrase